MKRILFLQTLLMFSVHAAGSGRANDFGAKRLLILGFDGVFPSALTTAETTHLRGLIANGTTSCSAFRGGHMGTPTQQATSSGSGWSSILPGTYANVNGIAGKFTSTDHGATVSGTYGGQSPEERTIFMILTGGGYPEGEVVETEPGLHDIPGIAFRHLGVPVNPDWGWHSGSPNDEP